MSSARSMSILPSRVSRALMQLTITFAILSLVSCSMSFDSPWENKASEIPQKAPAKTQKAPGQPEDQSLSSSSRALPVAGDSGRKWNKYMTDEEDVRYFCDEGAIAKSKGMVQIWTKREFPSGASQRAIVTLEEIDCSKARYRTLELHVTYSDGTTGRSNEATRWAKIHENSNEEFLLHENCK